MRTQVDEIRLENLQTGAVIDVNSNPSSHYLASEIDWGAVEGTHHNYSYVGQIGTYVTGTTVAGRELSITGWVTARTPRELTVYKQRLNKFFNPLYKVRLYYRTYFIDFRPLTSVKYQRDWSENNTVFCKWLVQGYAEDPLFGDANNSVARGANVLPGTFHFPWVIGTEPQSTLPPQDGKRTVMSYLSPSKTISVTNAGAIEVGMRIIFQARATVVNPKILNVVTQEYILINKTLASGETIEINTNDGQKIVKGRLHETDEFENYYKYKDPDSSWLKVYPGSNTFRYSADDGESDMEVTLYFYNRYLEVEEAHE